MDVVGDQVGGGAQGRLGRSVQVAHGDAGAGGAHRPDGGRTNHVAAGQHLAYGREDLWALLRDHAEEPGGEVDGGDALVVDERAQGGDGEVAFGGDDHLPTGEEGHPQFVVGDVEGVRRVEQDAVAFGGVPAPVGDEVEQVPVGDGDALGLAGGARGVHDVGELSRHDPRCASGVREGRFVGGGHEDGTGAARLERPELLVDQQHRAKPALSRIRSMRAAG